MVPGCSGSWDSQASALLAAAASCASEEWGCPQPVRDSSKGFRGPTVPKQSTASTPLDRTKVPAGREDPLNPCVGGQGRRVWR